MDLRVTKINNTKFNRIELMKKLLNNKVNNLEVCKKTIKKWKGKLEVLKKLKKVTIDRALREVLFTKKVQIECFEWLIKDLNYFSTFNEVSKVIPITRYHYTIVKNYIKEELTR